jgi:hypothetical protein
MMSETVLTINAETGEETERELTSEEIAEREEMQIETQAQKVQAEAKAAARESALAKLAELGLTAEEIAAL